jgi:hypothetical protein
MIQASTTFFVLFASCAIFIIARYLPYSVLQYTVGTKLGSFVLLGLVLYVLTLDQTLGLAVFLAVAALFLEQRRRTIDHVTNVTTTNASNQPLFDVKQLDTSAPNIVPGEVHPPRKMENLDDYMYEPSEEMGDDKFEFTDHSYNTKQPLETVPPQPNEVSEMLQQKGLANIN